jgi:murein L,D-transpeptidase YafK
MRWYSEFVRRLFCALVLFAAACAPREREPLARADEAIARVKPRLVARLQAKGLTWGAPIFIRIFKEEDQLEIWMERDGRYEYFQTYPICTYSGDLGPKLREGDRQSPEGFYSVGRSQMNPASRFHLSFNLGFPNAFDRANGRTGSALMVHGSCASIGCYAMTDRGIEEIYALADAALRGGQQAFAVHIFPFRMTAENLRKHGKSPWTSFWNDLKTGYDSFEKHRRPPRITVANRRYAVTS